MFRILLRNEFLKVYKSPVFCVLIFFPMLWVLLNFVFINSLSYEDFLMRIESTHKDKDPYNYVFRWYRMLVQYFLPAHYLAFLVYFVEQEINTWKKDLSMPIRLSDILLSRIVFISLCMFMSLFIAYLSLLGSIKTLSILKTDFNFSAFPGTSVLLGLVMVKVYILSAFFVPLLYPLMTRFRYYAVYFILAIIFPLIEVKINIFSYYITFGLKSYFVLRNLKVLYTSTLFGTYELISLFLFIIFSIFCISYINRIKHELC